ncbi:toll/interleukin-1 receptor domain-containing protein [Streptomyces sp. I05A-00742]|uniref:toll/interleukin-1 receptor domain-containing protein n=1 Tax=Streptomyces sp. I05A-00742 TaxID=2732853 RepID=UPI00148766EB|nr:toll/interleukin-1 receptor domain-containing protein [Streptomyces sp. I05A-00742]
MPQHRRWGIFISYRRADSAPSTGRLAADLRGYFGKNRVYLDIDSNTSAQNYISQLNDALAASRAVIAVLGPQWLDARGPDGRRRLDVPEDLVRVELETALRNGIALVPVLVQGATMPPAHLLPPSLKTMTYLQAVRLATEDWAYDFGRLLETLEAHAVVPASGPDADPAEEFTVLTTKRYERTVQATRRRAFDALTGAVELLHYPVEESSPEAAQVIFHARRGRPVTAKVIDAGPGRSTVVLELPTVRTGVAVAATTAMAPATMGMSFASLPALWAWQRRFARGFFDNVEGVLAGRGVGEDSSLLPGIHAWRNRKREL